MKRHLGWVLPASLFVLCVAIMAPIIHRDFLAAKKADAEMYQATYTAWCKLAHRTDITYSEWTLLYQRGLLKP